MKTIDQTSNDISDIRQNTPFRVPFGDQDTYNTMIYFRCCCCSRCQTYIHAHKYTVMCISVHDCDIGCSKRTLVVVVQIESCMRYNFIRFVVDCSHRIVSQQNTLRTLQSVIREHNMYGHLCDAYDNVVSHHARGRSHCN